MICGWRKLNTKPTLKRVGVSSIGADNRNGEPKMPRIKRLRVHQRCRVATAEGGGFACLSLSPKRFKLQILN